MNKILELIEAQKIFKLPSEKLDIVIHPNSSSRYCRISEWPIKLYLS